MRVAIYYTPPRAHALTRLAAAWLGRDAFSGQAIGPLAVEGIAPADALAITAEPRRYGFHATLKAPFALAEDRSLDDLSGALDVYCRSSGAASLGKLRVAAIGSFVALVPVRPAAEVHGLAAEIVRRFDPFRVPASDAELARRREARLTPDEDRNLVRWGYPYVLEAFRFHMSLTGQLPEHRRDPVITALRHRFDPVLQEPLGIDALALFVEPEPGAPFKLHARFPFASRELA